MRVLGLTFVGTRTDKRAETAALWGDVLGLDVAWARLRAAGIETDDEVSSNETQRYVHFRAPDGRLWELVEETSRD